MRNDTVGDRPAEGAVGAVGAVGAARGRELTRHEKRLVLGSLCLALFMVMIDGTVVNVALPSIQSDLGSGVSGLQWIVDGYVLALASLMLSGGTLGDLFGRRRALLSGITVFTVGSVACGLAPDVGALIAGRVLQGVGAAALLPGTLSILSNVFTNPGERARAIGVWAGISGIALASGPVLGGFLADTLGWQSIFFINLPIGVAAFVVIRRVAPESSDPVGRTLDLPGQVLTVVTLASLTYSLIEGNEKGWSSPPVVTGFAVAIVGLLALLTVERRSSSPMIQLALFRDRTFSAATASGAMVSFALFGMNVFFSLYFQRVQGYSALESGLRMLPITASMMVGMPVAGRLVARHGSKPVMVGGMATAAVGFLSLVTITADTPWAQVGPRMALIGIGMAMTMPATTASVMASVTPARAGMASATLNTSRQVGSVLGIAVLGAIVTSHVNSSLPARLDLLGVGGSARHAVMEALTTGTEGLSTVLPGEVPVELARRAYGLAYVDGMRVAVVVAGVSLLGACLLVSLLVRRRAGLGPAAAAEEPERALLGSPALLAESAAG